MNLFHTRTYPFKIWTDWRGIWRAESHVLTTWDGSKWSVNRPQSHTRKFRSSSPYKWPSAQLSGEVVRKEEDCVIKNMRILMTITQQEVHTPHISPTEAPGCRPQITLFTRNNSNPFINAHRPCVKLENCVHFADWVKGWWGEHLITCHMRGVYYTCY